MMPENTHHNYNKLYSRYRIKYNRIVCNKYFKIRSLGFLKVFINNCTKVIN